MKRLLAIAVAGSALALPALPALARDSFVSDGASIFNQATVDSLNRQIGDFNRRTGKEVVVVTVPSLDGRTIQDAAERAFAEQQVNGVLFYLAKAEKKDLILGDRASRAFFPAGTFTNIHDAMRGYFRQGDFDAGIATGVNLVLDQYRSHERAAGSARTRPVSQPIAPTSSQSTGGFHMSFFWLLIILLAGFLIIRALFRAMAGPRMMPPGAGGPGYGAGPGYGPGYGGGYGGGGGGSFFSGLLGGLGGAFLGNELFGGRGGSSIAPGGDVAGVSGGDAGGAPDAGGWQSDAGQADVGNAGGGDWGGGGGGFDAGGGGDFGGGGGGDGGGGW